MSKVVVDQRTDAESGELKFVEVGAAVARAVEGSGGSGQQGGRCRLAAGVEPLGPHSLVPRSAVL